MLSLYSANALLTNRMVFKISHGGEDLVNWFERTFEAQVLYLIRHPVPVTLSREVYPRLPFFLKNEAYRAFFNSVQVPLTHTIFDSGSDFENVIFRCCLLYYPPLISLDRSTWITLCYELLVLSP